MTGSRNRIDSMDDLEEVSGESYLDHVCVYKRLIQFVFAISVFFFLLSLTNVLFLEPESASQVIAAVNVVGTALFGTVSGALLYICNQRA